MSPRNKPVSALVPFLAFSLALVLVVSCGMRPPDLRKPADMAPGSAQNPKNGNDGQAKPPEGPGAAVAGDRSWGDAPDFTLERFGGGNMILSDNLGKIIILDFWATWCPPCRQEIPDFIRLQKEYGDRGFVMIGISLDRDGETAVRPYAEETGINYPVLYGFDHQEVTDSYGGIPSIPTTFIIDQQGDIVQKYVGYQSPNIFETKIRQMLGIIQEEKP